ncbi:Membrane protein involved in the export of O-antigen and teichoic acid [Pelagirhabdus alkalitolerans]|uniref:Membrane protein involved in the export of O-antigen and teichoic acid n=1 Tax=Pelagirhabdus alkalitolerans TaxID=1612202 RepID=A0A1G6GGI1_9BACI|nr:flippase [Pelagirhabdus alkalitolerans]SDB81060.1 Membrane protein involved in the export of O-antigen and teichoic acid [Pelagirhabdus alkalitolerans]
MVEKSNTGIDIILTFGTKLIFLGGSFIISVLLARLLGPDGKGVVTALFVVPNVMISLADLGVRQASAYFIGRNIYSVQDVLSSSLVLWIITSFISTIVVLSYYLMPFTSEYNHWLILIGLMYVPTKILVFYFNGIIQGQQKIGNINIKVLLSFITNLLGVLLLVWILDFGVYGAATVTFLVAFSSLIYFLTVIRKTARIEFKYIKPIPKEMFKKGIAFALALFILQLNYKIDIVILENMVSASEVGIYSVGAHLAELIWQLPAAISVVLFARSANSKTDGEASLRSARLLRLSLVSLLFVVMIFGLASNFFVTFIYGIEYQQSAQVINLLLPGVLMIVISKILHPSLAARGYPLYGLAVFIAPLMINVVLNLILIPLYSVNGAAIASTISYTIGGLTYGIVYAKKEHMKLRDLLIVKKEDFILIINILKKMK